MFRKQITAVSEIELNKRAIISKKKLNKRTILACFLILITIPLTILYGIYFKEDRDYYLISMIIIFQTMIPFFFSFESRKPQARELVTIATLVAIAVAGRSAFFWLPQFKPIVAIVIIAGVTLGAETGFLVGAMSFFVSNFFFSQGPWTPWQMFSGGIIGFIAGILFSKGLLKKNRWVLAIFGFFTTFIIYGVLMDTSSALMGIRNPEEYNIIDNFSFNFLLPYFITGLPFNLIHGTASFIFLIILANPMIEKIDRIKKKYGLLEP